MNVDECNAKLKAALPIRMPRFDPNLGAREKIEGLENHILLVAFHRGECEEALYWVIEAKKVLKDAWDGVEGWEAFLPRTERQKPTKEAVAAAKRQVDEGTYLALRDVQTMIDALAAQIKRFREEFESASRVYTLITGG